MAHTKKGGEWSDLRDACSDDPTQFKTKLIKCQKLQTFVSSSLKSSCQFVRKCGRLQVLEICLGDSLLCTNWKTIGTTTCTTNNRHSHHRCNIFLTFTEEPLMSFGQLAKVHFSNLP